MKYDPNKYEDDSQSAPAGSWKRLLAVIAGCVLYGCFMMVVFGNRMYAASRDETGPALLAFLFVMPLVIGAVSIFAIPPEHRTTRRVVGMALGTAILFMITAALMFSGIWLCVLMIAPFVLVPVVIGALIMRYVTRNREKTKRNYAFVGLAIVLPYLLAPLEAQYRAPDWFRTVQDEIVIRGTVEEVWQNIIRMDMISPDEQPPSFYQWAGIPRPVRATLDAEAVGGIRQGEFEYGLLFHEKITVWEPEREVRFTVEVQQNPGTTPALMQIGGRYFEILEAGYVIESRADGTVVLKLDSDYRLSTNFNFYGAFWSDWIMHDFQSYVLRTVKARVEAE